MGIVRQTMLNGTVSRRSLPGVLLLVLLLLLGVGASIPAPVHAAGVELAADDERILDENWKLSLSGEKGPFSLNYCVCKDGKKKPVQLPDGRIVRPCGKSPAFCSGFREPWAEELGKQRMWIANLFARDLWLWDGFPDHHDLVRGYILEKFFVETHPDHPLSKYRAYGGLSGTEFEARDAPIFFERYLAMPEFDEPRHFLLAYELQRRFYLREDQGQIGEVRNMATAIQQLNWDFKPLRDQVHNQLSADVIPRLVAWRDERARSAEQKQKVDELIRGIRLLTSLDQSALEEQLTSIEDPDVRKQIAALVSGGNSEPIEIIRRLSEVMLLVRRTVEAKRVSPADRRHLIDIDITAAAIINRFGVDLLASPKPLTAAQSLDLLASLTNAAYGSGLLMERERVEVVRSLESLGANAQIAQAKFADGLATAERVVEWAHLGANYAFEEVRAPWLYLVPDSNMLADDVLRGSVLMVYGQVFEQLRDWVVGASSPNHVIFGKEVGKGVRALNPGLATGTLRVAPAEGGYTRKDIVALPETPAELEPAAGIFTRGEGNVVSHVQLLARALGIPNVVLAPSVYKQFESRDGKQVFYVVTPERRVILKEAANLDERDRAVLAEFERGRTREGDGSFGGGDKKLHIDKERIDLGMKLSLDLGEMRRTDSGIRGGPKAAYLGELKFLFPDRVARGIVVPFGAYYEHYRRAEVVIPRELAKAGIAEPGTPLHAFVEATYAKFFGELIPGGTSEQELRQWIEPRLTVIRTSIEATPISNELKQSIRKRLAMQGLIREDDPTRTTGVFIRSDTNVEDLDDFNGAGLNLTLFDRRSLDDVFSGLKQVWASPFTYRSFSWRQALIDDPLWVLPSVVILESIPTEKSGVLVTIDVDRGDTDAMLIATSEGVGGAVDGSPAETLIHSADGTELVTMFKSPWRRMLQPEGESAIVPSTGSEYVLSDTDVASLTITARDITAKISPAVDDRGRPRPWDIEFGFADGKLWLFQVRPFLGSDSMQNLPSLAAYEPEAPVADRILSLDSPVK